MTPVLKKSEHAFRSSIGVDDVEELLAQGTGDDDAARAWRLDLSKVRNVQPGAGYRLGNALRRWSAGELVAVVPETDGFSGDWFLTFTRSGIGLSLARHADRILAGSRDVTDEVRDYYASKGNASATNYGVRIQLEIGALTPDIDRFAGEFLLLGASVRLSVAGLSRTSLQALIVMAFEAVTNVVDHAYEEPWDATRGGLSYLSLRYYEELSAKRGEHVGLQGYITRAKAAAEAAHQEIAGWIELVVCDDGVGIAARQTRNADVYRDAPQVEEQALRDALSTRESIKLLTRDAVTIGEPGYGYTLISDGLARLGAHAALRTGRRLAELDGTLSVANAFRLRDDVLGWMPGTALHVVFPLRDPQLHIPT